jgi:sulfatase modifying factor 1
MSEISWHTTSGTTALHGLACFVSLAFASATLAQPHAAEALPVAMVEIPGGTIHIGIAPEDPEYHVANSLHAVRISTFQLAAYEVTQGQWASVDGRNPSENSACGARCPVTNVGWYSALAFANWRSTQEGLPACYALVPAACADQTTDWTDGQTDCTDATFVGLTCTGYRLPTSAEWELAARAGDTGLLSANLSETAWYWANSGGAIHPAGQKRPNAFGLFDMFGNVTEWVWDRWGQYTISTSEPEENPLGPETGQFRMFRGGGFRSPLGHLRFGQRISELPNLPADGERGFRLARSPAR